MLDLEELSKIRFGMSEVPEVGGQPGTYEEKWTQWFLERSFFRDFVYRNPQKKKGQELADAVVLFDDVVLMVQIKAQCGQHDSISWATEKLLEAFQQLCKTNNSLTGGQVKKLKNDFYGDVLFDPQDYPNRIGLIILAHDSQPYVACKLAPEILTAAFPVHVFSLKDFAMVASRFDTAGDVVTFLEMRHEIGGQEEFLVQDEEGNIGLMIPQIEKLLQKHMPATPPEVMNKTVAARVEIATGKLLESPDWKYGLVIDDIIAHAHDVDSGLAWNTGNGAAKEVASFLGWLTRDRRIKLGKKVISICDAARDGKPHWFSHFQESRGTVCVYLATSDSRAGRVKHLQFLATYAYMKYGAQCIGVATEPLGGGRSYDFLVVRSSPPPELLDYLKTIDDPFTSDDTLGLLRFCQRRPTKGCAGFVLELQPKGTQTSPKLNAQTGVVIGSSCLVWVTTGV